MLEGKLQQPMTPAQIQLGADIGSVGFYGAMANAEFLGDLFAGAIFRNHAQNPALGRGQALQPGLFCTQFFRLAPAVNQKTGRGGTDEVLPRDGALNR